MSNIVTDLANFSNSIDDVTEKIKGLSLEDAKLVMDLAEVDAYTQSCALTNNKFSASAINAAMGVTADKAATDADTASKYANLKVTNLLKVAWGKLSAFVMANPWLVGITAAVAGLTALYMVVEHFTTTIEEAKEKTEEAYNELESITSEVESLTNKINELNKQINSLDPITNAEDIENLETETALLEAQLAILKEKERLAKEEANKAAEESMSKTVASKYSSTGMDTSGMMIAGEYVQGTSAIPEYVTETEELNLAIDAYKEAQDKMKSLREEQVRLEEEFGKNSDEYLANANEISTLDEEMTSMETHMVSLADSIETQFRALDGSTDKSKELQAESENVIGRYTDLITETNNYTDALNENTSAKQENVNETEILNIE